jgi:hypothetical protein
LQRFFLSLPFFSLCSLFSLDFLVVDSVAWAWWFGLADLGVVVDLSSLWVFWWLIRWLGRGGLGLPISAWWLMPIGFSRFCRLGFLLIFGLGLGFAGWV